MAPHRSTRLAWSVALLSFGLWAANPPATFGHVTSAVEHVLQQSGDDDSGWGSAPCAQQPANIDQSQPAAPLPIPTEFTSVGQDGTFHLCGANAQAARSIEQLIAGRGFNATLSARGDGCADLLIHATSPTTDNSSASSTLSVSLGSGQNLSIQIVSQGGVTHVSIGT